MRRCSECDRPYYARGFCSLHYQRMQAHGDPSVRLPNRPKRIPAKCTAPGCNRKYHSSGYCVVHWGRWTRKGSALATVELQVSSETGMCTVDGCERPHAAKGFCEKHYQRRPQRKLYRNYWRAKNKHREREYDAARRGRKLAATPAWVDRNELRRIYSECPDGYEVDHILPLQGDDVCGLHVPWNLQYLTASENRSKGNKVRK